MKVESIFIAMIITVCVVILVVNLAVLGEINKLEKYIKDIKLNVTITESQSVKVTENKTNTPICKVDISPTGKTPDKCFPEKYCIRQGNDGKFYAQFPNNGMIFGLGRNTITEAQKDVNKMVTFCREKWFALGE